MKLLTGNAACSVVKKIAALRRRASGARKQGKRKGIRFCFTLGLHTTAFAFGWMPKGEALDQDMLFKRFRALNRVAVHAGHSLQKLGRPLVIAGKFAFAEYKLAETESAARRCDSRTTVWQLSGKKGTDSNRIAFRESSNLTECEDQWQDRWFEHFCAEVGGAICDMDCVKATASKVLSNTA